MTEADRGTERSGFASIAEAIDDIRQGRMVVVVDDEDRENEGDFLMAADRATPRWRRRPRGSGSWSRPPRCPIG